MHKFNPFPLLFVLVLAIAISEANGLADTFVDNITHNHITYFESGQGHKPGNFSIVNSGKVNDGLWVVYKNDKPYRAGRIQEGQKIRMAEWSHLLHPI